MGFKIPTLLSFKFIMLKNNAVTSVFEQVFVLNVQNSGRINYRVYFNISIRCRVLSKTPENIRIMNSHIDNS